jgi:hypothetical protein
MLERPQAPVLALARELELVLAQQVCSPQERQQALAQLLLEVPPLPPRNLYH